ncbi:MAG TPA: hypothetical protein VIV12_28560 [Streptosporangiaceae bacterium]
MLDLLRRFRRRRHILVDRDEVRRALGLRPGDPDPADATSAVAALNAAYAIVEAEEAAWLNLDAPPPD